MGKRRWTDWEDWGNGDSWQLARGVFEGNWDVKWNHFCLSKKVICLISVITGFVSRCWLTRYVCVPPLLCHCDCVCATVTLVCHAYHVDCSSVLLSRIGLRCATSIIQDSIFVNICLKSTLKARQLCICAALTSCYETWDSIDRWKPGVL